MLKQPSLSVHNTIDREEVAQHDFPSESFLLEVVRKFIPKHYEKILPYMAKRTHNEKLRDVRSRLSYSESTEKETKNISQHHDPCGSKKKKKRRGCRFVVGVSEEDDGSGVRGSGVEQEVGKRGICVWRENRLVNS
nr:hypothetical protein [Tanacetum cinerariifolium]